MNFNRPLILASNSPRRQELLRAAGLAFTVKTKEVDETYPSDVAPDDVASFLARKKAQAYTQEVANEVLITADTIVKLNNKILGKPGDYDEAFDMLTALSGSNHEVITGVCITTKKKEVVFKDVTRVWFKALSDSEIDYYITNYQPFDKAGAYGIQECLPADVNLCSQEELNFLQDIDKPDIFEKTKIKKLGKELNYIEKIKGSYFNVVGLPVHRVYDALVGFHSKD